jgi:hypothetical protein
MCDARRFGKRAVNRCPIRTQDGLWVDQRLERLANMDGIELLQYHIDHRATAVPDHENRRMIRACSPGPADAAPFAPDFDSF